jgi:hypothetical protein
MVSRSALSSRRSPWSGPSTSSHRRRARCPTLSRPPGLPPTPPYIGPSRRGTPSRLPTCLSCHGATCLFSTSAKVNPSRPPPCGVPRRATGVPPVADEALWKRLAWGPSS